MSENAGKISKKCKHIILPCDCRCCMFVVEKTKWNDGDVNYDISIQDSRYDHNYNTAWGRIKRAFSVLFGKPVYYNDVYIGDENVFKQFVRDIDDLVRIDL